jgi:hypothetical protein
MPAKRRQRRRPAGAAETDYARQERIKDFLLACPPLPTDEAGRWRLYFETGGYREVTARELGPCCWRIKARPPMRLLGDADARRDARRIVRRMGRKLLSPGVAAQVGTRWATFVILLMPEDGVFLLNEELLPERYRQPGPDDLMDEV